MNWLKTIFGAKKAIEVDRLAIGAFAVNKGDVLVIESPKVLRTEQREYLSQFVSLFFERTGAQIIVLDGGLTLRAILQLQESQQDSRCAQADGNKPPPFVTSEVNNSADEPSSPVTPVIPKNENNPA